MEGGDDPKALWYVVCQGRSKIIIVPNFGTSQVVEKLFKTIQN
jgi:hypothetical protein